MKKITIKVFMRSTGREKWKTLEIDDLDDNRLISEYMSDKDGNAITRDLTTGTGVKTTVEAPIREPQPVESPAARAMSLMDQDPVMAKKEDLEIMKSLEQSFLAILGFTPDRKVSAQLYRAGVDHYASAIRVQLSSRRKPGTLEVGPEVAIPTPGEAFLSRKEIREVQRKFLDQSLPCFFADCEELREARNLRIESAGGVKCKNCEKTSINREFAKKAVEAYSLDKKNELHHL